MAVDQHALEASANLRASYSNLVNSKSNRKRALSASPGYSELDLANLMRHSPTSLQLLGAAAVANGGSPSSSGSYGHLSGKLMNSRLLNPVHHFTGNSFDVWNGEYPPNS